MMLNALKKAIATKTGKIYLLLMIASIVVLLAMGNLNVGKLTFFIYLIPAFASVFFGDQFVKIATYYMQEEVDKKDQNK